MRRDVFAGQVLVEVPDEEQGGGKYERVKLLDKRPALSEVSGAADTRDVARCGGGDASEVCRAGRGPADAD